MRRRTRGAWLGACTLVAAGAHAAVFLTQDKALELAFGAGARVERTTAFLTHSQVERARALAGPGVEIVSALVTRYVGRDSAGRVVATAYFDTHRVRTLQETMMIVVDPAGRVARVEILAFGEPPEYLPKRGWLDQFTGRPLDDDLSVKRGVRGITGATMSSQASTDAVRRVLAIHEALK